MKADFGYDCGERNFRSHITVISYRSSSRTDVTNYSKIVLDTGDNILASSPGKVTKAINRSPTS